MSEISLTINGREITAEAGATVLDAARDAGIEIPTLCEHEQLKPFGGCRLCTVEVTQGAGKRGGKAGETGSDKGGNIAGEKARKSRLVASCVYPAEEGLDVRTETERVVEGRRLILELLLARAPGVEILREYGTRYGVDMEKFQPEPSYCILCGLCVRYCAEVKGACAIGFVGRGAERQVMFLPEVAAKECPQCGECFKLCPTGVLPSNYGVARVPHFRWPANPFR
jgi:bidirectional [NiFe] hydrogenase diaphorase subunit